MDWLREFQHSFREPVFGFLGAVWPWLAVFVPLFGLGWLFGRRWRGGSSGDSGGDLAMGGDSDGGSDGGGDGGAD